MISYILNAPVCRVYLPSCCRPNHRQRTSSPAVSRVFAKLRVTAPVAFVALAILAMGPPPAAFAQNEYDDQSGSSYDESYDQQMYDMGSDGGSSRRSMGRGSSPQDLMAERLSEALTSVYTSANLGGLTDPDAAPPIQEGPVLLNESVVAYTHGDYPLALRLFFGHIVAEYESAQPQINLVQYSGLMKRPAWQLQWGISFAVRGEATDPQPIKDTPQSNRGGFGQGGYGEDEMAMRMDMEMQGDQGGMTEDYDQSAMEEQMQMEMEMQMQQMAMGMSGGRMPNSSAPKPPPTPGARLAELDRSMLSEEAETELSESLGLVTTMLGEEFDKRYAEGRFGRALNGVTPDSGSPETVSNAFADLLSSSANTQPLWHPGIAFVGKGDADDMIANARKSGLDLLIHIDVLLKPLRGEFVQNICRCRLLHVPTGKSLGVSKPIDSLEAAQKAHAKGTASRDYVAEQLSNFLAIIDRSAVTTDLPTLTPEVASRRIGSILASGGGRNLRTLAEVRLFQSQQLLSDEEVIKAFDIVGGDEALQMMYASEEERLRIVHKWAAGDASEPDGISPQ
ncbi:hypothetical protein NHH03_04335 [Stieleria sp. TO1_6]|uniref:hypothetical protein n=1 Tax=Stieleria tagensis TaxID=2956795 RepID=UPI00209B6426|nr:hypothetical protein [Stieleria tagensis]MCO8120955.1 hypothetical protein [Stieleria tagensis]